MGRSAGPLGAEYALGVVTDRDERGLHESKLLAHRFVLAIATDALASERPFETCWRNYVPSVLCEQIVERIRLAWGSSVRPVERSYAKAFEELGEDAQVFIILYRYNEWPQLGGHLAATDMQRLLGLRTEDAVRKRASRAIAKYEAVLADVTESREREQ